MFYQILRAVIKPLILIMMLTHGKKGKFLKKRLRQDFTKLEIGDYIWVHCSSVGEINLSETLIKKLLDMGNERILLTMFTDTGIGVAREKFIKNPRVDIYYFPLDDKKIIENILSRIHLKLLILVETEIWPNLISQCSEVAKVVMVNGRISDRSFKRYLKLKKYLKKLFLYIDKFYMQSQEDSRRIVEIGALNSRVETTGNLKFDISFQEYSEEEKVEIKANLNVGDRSVFVCGSTRTGEYEVLLETFKKLKNTLLVLVPRHIEKTPQVEEIVKSYGFTYIKYSELEKENQSKSTDVIIVDKIGILRKLYSISDIAFVGGTLVNIGGHSLLEPLFYGKTPIFGTYLQNVKEISQEILKYGIGYKIKDSEEMLKAINELKLKQELSKDLIKELFEKNSHTADRIVADLYEIDSKKYNKE